MARMRISRRFAVAVACVAAMLTVPSAAMALTTHSATTSTVNPNGFLVAKARCGANERVVSGGYKSSVTDPSGVAVASRAVRGDAWKVRYWTSLTLETLTAYAYCAHKGQLPISKQVTTVTAQAGPINNVATASCASGQTLLSGGYSLLAPQPHEENSPVYRDYAASARKWRVMAVLKKVPGQLEAFAYCSPGVTVKVRSASTTLAPFGGPAEVGAGPTGDSGSATARCHAGETLLAGGYTTTPKPDWDNHTGPDFFYSGSYRSGRRSWTASATNYSNVAGTLTVFAYCRP